jgi:arginine decarboxylase
MLPIPQKFTLVAGGAEGKTELNAFDNALLASGVGNMNLLRVSSILPPYAVLTADFVMPPGSLLPIAYGSLTSDQPGELIAAAVAVGIAADSFGVIMEFSGRCSGKEAEDAVKKMVEEAFTSRNIKLEKVLAKAAEHRVEGIGCVFAAVPLWY